MELIPVGIVHSSIRSRSDMPVQGVDAGVEVFPGYAGALLGIEGNSHLILVCWLHEADRSVLRAVARKVSHDLPEKGVFSLRSPSRPNPLSISVVRLLGVREGRYLSLANVDLIDGRRCSTSSPTRRDGTASSQRPVTTGRRRSGRWAPANTGKASSARP
jgi:tRNA-Thr(GGU) m(6)t(6)A37 methyltransferase TsaA